MIRHRIFLAAAVFLAGLRAGPAPAGEGGESGEDVVILVNAASPESESVGAHYAKRRNVPDKNVCRVRCTTSEVVSRREFEASIRRPLRRFLLEQGHAQGDGAAGPLRLKVKYLVSAYGLPVKIRDDYSRTSLEDMPSNPGQWLVALGKRDAAAVDSELSLVALGDYPLGDCRPNALYRKDRAAEPLLFATRLDGPTPEIARGLVDAALHAEQHGLFGVAYVDRRGLREVDPGGRRNRYFLGDRWLLNAQTGLQEAGFFVRSDRSEGTFPGDMPMRHAAFYFGWYQPGLCGPMAKAGFRFSSGAVAYHIHSGSAARIRSTRLGWVGPLLERGAAATVGSVFEPSLERTLDVGEFAKHFLVGRSFAESAYRASPCVSWMLTYVGDPLYAPFREDRLRAALAAPRNAFWRDMRDAVLAAQGREAEKAIALCARHAAAPLFVEMKARALFLAGRRAASMTVYRRLADMVEGDYSSVAVHAIIGDWLASSGNGPGALAAYQTCLSDHAASPHALPVYRKALRLARRLRLTRAETDLLAGLAANFPDRALGRFAAGELWARGLRRTSDLPRIHAPAVTGRVALDARPTDPAWQDATVIESLPHRMGRPSAGRRTRVRLIADDAALYVLAEMYADLSSPASHGAVVTEESFRMMLSPWRDAEHAVPILIPRKPGRRPGERLVLPRGATRCVGPLRVEKDGRVLEIGWVVELRVPFASLGVRRPRNTLWAANVVHRCSVPEFPFKLVPSITSWAPMDKHTDPLAPECAGHLIFR